MNRPGGNRGAGESAGALWWAGCGVPMAQGPSREHRGLVSCISTCALRPSCLGQRGRLQGPRAHWTLALRFPAEAGSAVGRTGRDTCPAGAGLPSCRKEERASHEGPVGFAGYIGRNLVFSLQTPPCCGQAEGQTCGKDGHPALASWQRKGFWFGLAPGD